MQDTILVTGGAGYIGSHVVRQLSEAGRSVVVYDNLSTGFADALIHGEELVVGDLADTARLAGVFRTHRIGAVMHFAASIVAPESVTKPLWYYSNNALNTLHLVQACVAFGVERIIFSSTAAVYGEPSDGIASEDSPLVPMSPYGSSKLMGEWILRDVAIAHGIRYVSLRYFNASGADSKSRMGERHDPETHLIPLCLKAVKKRTGVINIYGTDYDTPDGTCIRDYIHVEDLAQAHLAALAYLEQGGRSTALNAGYGRGNSVREVVDVVRKVTGFALPVREVQRRPGDPATLVARADRIKITLGWQPRFNDLTTIVRDAWNWEKKTAEKSA